MYMKNSKQKNLHIAKYYKAKCPEENLLALGYYI
jgi:hypothetical protein